MRDMYKEYKGFNAYTLKPGMAIKIIDLADIKPEEEVLICDYNKTGYYLLKEVNKDNIVVINHHGIKIKLECDLFTNCFSEYAPNSRMKLDILIKGEIENELAK